MILTCRPGQGKTEEGCATQILGQVARRAWRRPVTQPEAARLLAFYRQGRKDSGEFEGGIELGLKAILVSPNFLFRVETGTGNLSDLALASRLSFFLWSSIPDEQLLGLAERGELSRPGAVQAQVRRMLADPKAEALTANFAGQWLHLRNLTSIKPDPEKYPEFDSDVRAAMQREAELFFESVIKDNRSVLDFIDARYTFRQRASGQVLRPEGCQRRRVPPRGVGRWTARGRADHGRDAGGDVLSYAHFAGDPREMGTRESARRDRRLLRRRMCRRYRRKNSARRLRCGSNWSNTGRIRRAQAAMPRWTRSASRWRITIRSAGGGRRTAGFEIDSAGKLPSGEEFKNAAELKAALRANPREFILCFTEKLMTYATGRGIEWQDKPAVRAVAREAAKDDYRFASMVEAIVESAPFRMRGAPAVKMTEKAKETNRAGD